MKNLKKIWSGMLMLMLAFICTFAVSTAAEDYSDGASGDNSLYSLGLINATDCSPEFYYSTTEYNVTVPAGADALELDPVKSDSNAEIIDISGTALENGRGTTQITVQAENGARVTYTLYVTAEASAVAETEVQETEAQTEDTKAAEAAAALESEREALEQQKAQYEQREEQFALLQTENDDLAYRLDLLMKALYGLVAFAVILLFFIINQSFRNKDLKDDIKRLEREMESGSSDYYVPLQQSTQPIYVSPQEEEPQLTKKEIKQLEKEAKKAAKKEARQVKKSAQEATELPEAPAETRDMMQQERSIEEAVAVEPKQPQRRTVTSVEEAVRLDTPTLVQGSVEEPDIQVDMIDL